MVMNNEVTMVKLKRSNSVVIYSKSKVLMERVAELTGKHNTQITYAAKDANWSLLYTSIYGSLIVGNVVFIREGMVNGEPDFITCSELDIKALKNVLPEVIMIRKL